MIDKDAEISRLKRQVLALEAQHERDEQELARLRIALRNAQEESRGGKRGASCRPGLEPADLCAAAPLRPDKQAKRPW